MFDRCKEWVNVFVKKHSSAEQIRLVLSKHGPMTPKQIAERTGIPARTVRHALKKLKDQNVLRRYKDLDDLRLNVYAVQEG